MKMPQAMRARRSNIPLTSVLCLLTAACAGIAPGGGQKCAGINDVNIAYNPDSGQLEASLCGGKENENVKLSATTPKGLEFHYEAQGSTAFAGQINQAELYQALSRERNETIRELISGMKSLAPLIPVPAR